MLTSKNIKFNKDGKLKNSLIVYNTSGFPKGIDVNFGSLSFNVNFVFDKNNLISAKMVREKPNPINLEVEYEFENGEMSKE